MKWFGNSWGGYICTLENHIETPKNAKCTYCIENIEYNDRGVLVPYYSNKNENINNDPTIIIKKELAKPDPIDSEWLLPETWYAIHIDCWIKMLLPNPPNISRK